MLMMIIHSSPRPRSCSNASDCSKPPQQPRKSSFPIPPAWRLVFSDPLMQGTTHKQALGRPISAVDRPPTKRTHPLKTLHSSSRSRIQAANTCYHIHQRTQSKVLVPASSRRSRDPNIREGGKKTRALSKYAASLLFPLPLPLLTSFIRFQGTFATPPFHSFPSD
jgi:hypothetical protein